MKNILILLGLLFAVCSCDDYFHDSGLADGKHDCTMWEYLNTQPQDWDSTVLLIERAGLVDLFDGKDHEHPEITFFGVTDLSIEQFLLKTVDEEDEPLYARVEDIPVDLCREMLLSHVVPGKIMKEEFDYEIKGTLTGGTMVTTLSGVELRVYRTRSEYGGVPDIGAEGLSIHAMVSGQMASVASANIETWSGVVHSLSYTYQFTEL